MIVVQSALVTSEPDLQVAAEGHRRGVLVEDRDHDRARRRRHGAEHRRARRVRAVADHDPDEIVCRNLAVRDRQSVNRIPERS